MIQDATGKFSSRCVVPDRRSLALLIGLVASVELAAAKTAHAASRADPIYGKFAGETNAISGFSAELPGLKPSSFRGDAPARGPGIQKSGGRFGFRVRASRAPE